MFSVIKQKMAGFFKTNQNETNALCLPLGSAWGNYFDGEQEPFSYCDDNFVLDVDYYELAKRAYTLVTINEFARIGISRLTQFAISTGLRLHPEPRRKFLKRKYNIELEKDFSKEIQELWGLFEHDRNVSSTKERTLHQLANQVFLNAFIAGDVLVIKRIKNENLEYQIVNGLSVYSSKLKADNSENVIKSGVEIDKNGRHVAYYILKEDGKEERIKAFDSKGRRIAWLVYGSDDRLNSVRGYSPLGAIVQKLRYIGKYANSEVIAADANARFAATIEHEKESSGINPMKGMGFGRSVQNAAPEQKPRENRAEINKFQEFVKKIPAGIFFNVPKGQKMSSFDTKRPNVNYTGFLDGSMKYIFAALGIPFEVAVLMFSNNFSASRAALKMFELIIDYFREFSIINSFYQVVYEQFFELECLKGSITAPHFLELKNDLGYMDNAYTKAKFFGKKIPHIDELKEVNAVLAKLKGGLMTYEQALEVLGNTVDFDTLVETRKREQKQILEAGLNFDSLLFLDDEQKQYLDDKEDEQ